MKPYLHASLKFQLNAYQQALADFETTIENLLPAGTHINWSRGGHTQSGFVKRHSYGGRIWATNQKTLKEVKITVHDIITAADQEPQS